MDLSGSKAIALNELLATVGNDKVVMLLEIFEHAIKCGNYVELVGAKSIVATT